VAVALFWPMKQHVTLNFILEPEKMNYLRSEVDGVVHWAEGIDENVWLEIEPDDARLALRLDNPELGYEKVRLEVGIEQSRVNLAQAKKRGIKPQSSRLSSGWICCGEINGDCPRSLAIWRLSCLFPGEFLVAICLCGIWKISVLVVEFLYCRWLIRVN